LYLGWLCVGPSCRWVSPVASMLLLPWGTS
jgi:hypothetical protein